MTVTTGGEVAPGFFCMADGALDTGGAAAGDEAFAGGETDAELAAGAEPPLGALPPTTGAGELPEAGARLAAGGDDPTTGAELAAGAVEPPEVPDEAPEEAPLTPSNRTLVQLLEDSQTL